ncbi:hypothetical protein BDD12DRAFT_837069 [Trichophaea hybrida]|nr:hypothetical protein BDD12DRAFT_837069 [Trichophaea hybrida]
MLLGWTTLTIEWALALLSLIFVLLRIYVRFTAPSYTHNRSDVIVVCAWLALASMVACDSALYRLGLFEGPNVYDKSLLLLNSNPKDSIRMLKIIYASIVPYTIVIYLVKAAVVTWFYMITPRTLPRCRIALHIISAVCICSFCLALGFNGLSCFPISRNWSLDVNRLCIASARLATFFTTFGCHLGTDIMIFMYPFSLLRSVHLIQRKQKKWGIIFLFTLGFLAIISTCARVIAISISATTPVIAICTAIECASNILIACCPALRDFIQSNKPPVRTTKDHHLKSYTGSADSYISNNHTTVVHQGGIWDGTESTAPQWIRLESYGLRDLEKGNVNGFVGSEGQDGISNANGVMTPELVFHPGRGIVRHAPGFVAPLEGTPCWMNIPDVPFLCEKKPEGAEEEKNSSSSSTTTSRVVRWDVAEDSSGSGGQGGKAPLLKREGMD